MADESTDTPKSWKKFTALLCCLAVALLIHVSLRIYRQQQCKAIVEGLAAGEETAFEEAVSLGKTAMPYMSRTFYYDLDTGVRQRVGKALLAALRKSQQDAPSDGEGRAKWQESTRTTIESDMTSKALRDEDPEVRRIAAQITEIIGFEHRIEEGRYERWQNAERLVERLRRLAPEMSKQIARLRAEAEKKLDDVDSNGVQVQADLDKAIGEAVDPVMREWRVDEVVGEFGNSVLVGIIADPESPEMRAVATEMLREMLATAYRADDREEMIKLIGHRRLRTLLKLLAEEVPEVETLLSFSPHISRYPKLLPGIQKELQNAKAKGEEAYSRALSFWKDRFSDVEEGSKGALRNKAVSALIGEVVS